MRGAFVVRLGPQTKPLQGSFEGWVEEVDSYRELRFRSTEELLRFLGDRFQEVFGSDSSDSEARQTDASSGETDP
jgi:hypothetical protein